MAVQARPSIAVYVGMSGSGKGVSIERALHEERPSRFLAWDPRDEYPNHAARFDSLPLLVQAFKKAGPRGIKARYVHNGRTPIAEAFGIVCALAFEAGHLTFLAEELSDVTRPSFAPPQWRRCITQGRHRGLSIKAATQRPALIDKTIMGNATRIRCFMLGYQEDRATMARELDAPLEAVAALSTEETGAGAVIRYLERERRPPKLYAGTITVAGARYAEKRAEGATPPGAAT